MSTRSGRIRPSIVEVTPPRTRKGISPSRSPARTRRTSPPVTKTPPPARSTGRKSPARKSPSRKPVSKFPARKSPSRATKDAEVAPSAPKSPAKRPPIQTEVAVKLEDFSSKFEILRSTRSKRAEYTVKDITSSISNSEFSTDTVNGIESNDFYGLRNRKTMEEIVPRRSSRLREFMDGVPDIRRSVSKSLSSKSLSQSVSKSLDYSDEEHSEEDGQRKSLSVMRKLATPLRSSISSLTKITSKWEFGGRIGTAMLLLLIPLTVFSIIISSYKSCRTNIPDLTEYKKLQTWISIPAFSCVISQTIIQAAFAVLPIFGTKSDRMDETGTKYCFNAFFSSIFTVNALFILDFLQIIDRNILLTEYFKLAVIAYIFAVTLSIILYVKSSKMDKNELNEYGNSGYTVYDFFIGREIHPLFKKLDIKVWISRISNINCLILLSLVFAHGLKIKLDKNETITTDNYKEFLSKVQMQPTILLFSLMQIVYILNFIMKEHKITTTFFWHSEGLGYLQIVSSSLYPYYFTIISKHIADSKLVLSSNILIISSVIYLAGLVIMLVSNDIKHEFRRNPHVSLANVDIIPTFHGNKILVSGLWGVLRHPNYTGDILIHIALSLPGIVTGNYISSLPALVTIVVLMHRVWRDHERCKRRYGAAWQRYCKRVPSALIPKIL